MVRRPRAHGLIYVSLFTSLIGLAVVSGSGCSSKASSNTCHAINGGCAGVPDGNVCGGDTCTDGVTCSSVVSAHDDASLASAISQAASGACIALVGGTYGDAKLPGGVSLLGKGAGTVTVHSVSLAAGAGAVVRGMTVGQGGIALLDGATSVRIDSVHVLKADVNAVTLGVGASATIASSTLEAAGSAPNSKNLASGGYAVYGAKAASLDLEKTYIVGTYGPGVWLQSCDDGCTCAAATTMSMHGIIIEGAELVALALSGVNATLDDVTLKGTAAFHLSGEQGGGLAAFQCTKLTATNFKSLDNKHYGVLVDHSNAQIGDVASPGSTQISGNQTYGAWVQNIAKAQDGSDQGVSLSGVTLDSNAGVGLGLDGSAHGIIIEGCVSKGTASKTMPAMLPGQGPSQSAIGDGLVWGSGVVANIKSLTVEGNARAGALIGGQWGNGSSMGLSLGSGNPHGIIIEGIPLDVVPPNLSVDGSQVTRTATYDFALPVGPAAPTAIKIQ